MNANRIHEDITRLLYKIEEQYSHILQQKDQISILDVDVALKDITVLYEAFWDLRAIADYHRKQTPETTEKTKDVVKNQPIAETPAPINQAQEIQEKAQPETNASLSEKTEKTQIVEPAPIAWQRTFDASTTAPEDLAKPSPSPVNGLDTGASIPPQVTAPKVDLLKEREKDFVPTVKRIEFKPDPSAPEVKRESSIFEKAASLYDKIAKPVEKTINSQVNKQPISNIKSSIGLNERLGYLKDLFGNNPNEFNEALDKLNNFDSYAEAEDYFQELKNKYNWDPEGKSFMKLAELLSRRYLHSV